MINHRVRLFLVLFLGCSLAGLSQEPKLAPINPEFLDYIKTKNSLHTPGQFSQTDFYGLVPSPLNLSYLNRHPDREPATKADLPVSYDLRILSRVTPVKNQLPYGTCWAHASYASLESCQLPGQSWIFSENNLANRHGFDNGYDDGGTWVMSTAYLTRWSGPINEADDPYPNPGNSPTGLTVRAHAQQVDYIPGRTGATDNAYIKQTVIDRGALYTSMLYNDAWGNWTNGAYYYTGTNRGNHAVAIVGWNDAYGRTNFLQQPAGDGAFIVKNSFGTNWADNGYFYISYYDSICAREGNASFWNAESVTNYSSIYQYDPLGWVSSLTLGTNIGWGANKFQVSSTGSLSAVGLWIMDHDTAYQVYIFTETTNPPAESVIQGTLHSTQTGSCTWAGYHTIPLTTPVLLDTGRVFSVVVKFVTSVSRFTVPIEYAVSNYSSLATASTNQSFYSGDGSYWTDATAYNPTMNVCIKAFLSSVAGMLRSPANVMAGDGTLANRVRLTWYAVDGATNYLVYRNSTNCTIGLSQLAQTNSTTYEDTSAQSETLYYYWVKAQGVSGDGPFSMADTGYRAGGLVPVYRLYSYGAPESTYEHLWTTSETEKNVLSSWPSWQYEGVAWYALTNQLGEAVPLYRLYAPSVKQHHYTIDANEYAINADNGTWNGEGIQYYVEATGVSGAVPVYRFYHAGLYLHHFTVDETEKDSIIANPDWGYTFENTAFYVYSSQ